MALENHLIPRVPSRLREGRLGIRLSAPLSWRPVLRPGTAPQTHAHFFRSHFNSSCRYLSVCTVPHAFDLWYFLVVGFCAMAEDAAPLGVLADIERTRRFLSSDYPLRPLIPRHPDAEEAAASARLLQHCRGVPIGLHLEFEYKDDGRTWIAVGVTAVAIPGSLGPLCRVLLPAGSHCTIAVLPASTSDRQRSYAIAAAHDLLERWLSIDIVCWMGSYSLHPSSPHPGEFGTPFMLIAPASPLHARLTTLTDVAFDAAGLQPRSRRDRDYHLRLGLH